MSGSASGRAAKRSTSGRAKTRAKATPKPELSPLGRQIQSYVCARVPILYLVTWEEGRVVSEIEQVAIAQRKRCHVWTETEGAQNVALLQAGKSEPEDRRVREPAAILARILREARDSDARKAPGAIYVLKDFHPYLDKNGIRRRLRDLAEELLKSKITVVILAPRLNLPQELQKAVTVVDVPLPQRSELDVHLEAILASGKLPSTLAPRERDELVRSAQGMTLREFEQSLALSVGEVGELDARAIPLVLREKEQTVRKSSALECVSWEEGFDSVGGLARLKSFLAARRDAFTAEARAYGLPAPRGLCLIGVQGCGKSLSAKAVARFYNLPLLRFDVGRAFAGLVGQSEENARAALRLADSLAPCVLWIDELEKSLAGARSSSASDGGTTARVISTITTWLQERPTSGVYVVATANDISALPPELLRKGRFDEIFFVDLPATSERRSILSIHVAKRGRDPEAFDLDRVAGQTTGFSGAELEEAVIAALYKAFADGRREPVTEDLLGAVAQTVPLSHTMREQVEGLRTWAQGRARRASDSAESGPQGEGAT
jgi:SpoVK/Ycf46/Vps4 family AAA+-type ATPase